MPVSITPGLQQVTDVNAFTTNQITILNDLTATDVSNGTIAGLAVGTTNSIGGSLAGQSSLISNYTLSGSTAFSGFGYNTNLLTNYSASADAAIIGGINIQSSLSSAQTLTSFIGATINTSYSAAATISDITGLAIGVGGSNNANITKMTGARSSIGFGSSPVIPTIVHFDAVGTVLGTSVVTNAYGFRYTDYTSGNDPTNNHGIYIPALTKGTNKYEILIDNAGGLFLGGSAARAKIYHDGTDLIIDSTHAGSGVTRFKSDSTGDIICDRIGLGGSPITNFFWINYVQTTSAGRGALNFDYTYTGAGPQANILSYPTYSGTSATPLCLALQGRVRSNSDHTGTGTFVNVDAQFGTSATTTITQGVKNFLGMRIQHNQGTGTANTGGQINTYGIQILGFTNYAGVAGEYQTGIYSAEDIEIVPDALLGFDAAIATKSTTYMTYNAGATELQTFVLGAQMIGVQTNAIGFYGTAPTIQYTGTGVTSMPVPGGINKVYDDSAFDGGVGGSTCTIDDIVLALKLLGFLAP